MCAIESAAKTNPKALVQIHTFSSKLNKNANKLKQLYPNIRLIDFKPEEVFNNTPILNLWLKGVILKSPFAYFHLSDAFR